jgi:hypothetical protein
MNSIRRGAFVLPAYVFIFFFLFQALHSAIICRTFIASPLNTGQCLLHMPSGSIPADIAPSQLAHAAYHHDLQDVDHDLE